MNRRDLMTLIGGAAVWPVAARGQTMPVIGYLSPGIADKMGLPAFYRGLAETGYVEGNNVAIEYRWANGRLDQLPALAADLVDHKVSVIVAPGSPASALAAKGASATMPIVFATGVDPVEVGLVKSLNRPGGNLTGVASLTADLTAKRLEFLHELVAAAASIAFLVNPTNPANDGSLRVALAAAPTLGLRVAVLKATNPGEIDAAFESLSRERGTPLVVSADTFFLSQREQFVALAIRHGIPVLYTYRELVEAGGLMSYGPSLSESRRLLGVYAGRILKGEKPADLPVQQSTKVELIINFKTAKALNLTVPPSLLAVADEVIE
jgi:putative tryptophan/tyrosine transport system substrate-binding protein